MTELLWVKAVWTDDEETVIDYWSDIDCCSCFTYQGWEIFVYDDCIHCHKWGMPYYYCCDVDIDDDEQGFLIAQDFIWQYGWNTPSLGQLTLPILEDGE